MHPPAPPARKEEEALGEAVLAATAWDHRRSPPAPPLPPALPHPQPLRQLRIRGRRIAAQVSLEQHAVGLVVFHASDEEGVCRGGRQGSWRPCKFRVGFHSWQLSAALPHAPHDRRAAPNENTVVRMRSITSRGSCRLGESWPASGSAACSSPAGGGGGAAAPCPSPSRSGCCSARHFRSLHRLLGNNAGSRGPAGRLCRPACPQAGRSRVGARTLIAPAVAAIVDRSTVGLRERGLQAASASADEGELDCWVSRFGPSWTLAGSFNTTPASLLSLTDSHQPCTLRLLHPRRFASSCASSCASVPCKARQC